MHKKLFIPGPVDVREDVLQKMATPQIGHRTKDASALQRSISDKLRKVFYTENEIILSTSSGSGLMEGAIRSCTRKRAAVFSVGAFGDRWFKMAKANAVPADKFSSQPGYPTTPQMVDEALSTGKYDVITVTHNETSAGIMNPVAEIGQLLKEKYPDVLLLVDTVSSMGGTKIEVDKWGIDVCITSTQKCLGLPAGMSICSVSKELLKQQDRLRTEDCILTLLNFMIIFRKRIISIHQHLHLHICLQWIISLTEYLLRDLKTVLQDILKWQIVFVNGVKSILNCLYVKKNIIQIH